MIKQKISNLEGVRMPNPSPLQCFVAGHNLGYVGSYFDQVLLAAQVERTIHPKAKEHTQNMVGNPNTWR